MEQHYFRARARNPVGIGVGASSKSPRLPQERTNRCVNHLKVTVR
jgi:hypothetical protein